MACSIEMIPCDRCGREVERYAIYIVKDEEGRREFVCADCAGEAAESPQSPPPAEEC